MQNEQFEKLKLLLEGKTISKVLPPDADEAICKFVLSDGSAFRLHATDLGFWTEPTGNAKNIHQSLHSMILESNIILNKDYYKLPEEYKQKVNIKNNKLTITINNINIVGDISKFSDDEKKVISHKLFKKILKEATLMGPFWKIILKSYPELKLVDIG